MVNFSISCPSWMPVWVRRFPLSLLANLFALVLVVAGNTAISFHFVGKPYSESFFKDPRKWMSLIGVLGNVTMNWSYMVAAQNKYWHKAMTTGLTLSEFHYQWMAAFSIVEATRGFKIVKKITSTCWTVVLAASSYSVLWGMAVDHGDVTTTNHGITNVHMTSNIVPILDFASNFTLDGPISAAQRAYARRSDIQLSLDDICDDCHLHALGFGWSANCSDSNGSHYLFESGAPASNQQLLFQISTWDETSPDNHVLIVRSDHKSESGCAGAYATSYCVFTPSILEYNIRVTGKFTTHAGFETVRTLTLDDAMENSLTRPGQTSLDLLPADNSRIIHDHRLRSLAGDIQARFGTVYTAVLNPKWWKYDLLEKPASGTASSIAIGYSKNKNAEEPCNMTFDSPIKDIKAYINEIAFRVSALTATYTNVTQLVLYTEEKTEDQWRHSWIPSSFGIALTFLAFLAAAYPDWGWWNRILVDCSMSPLVSIQSVAASGDGPQSILPFLKDAPRSAAGLKKFAKEWDKRGQRLVYEKGPDGCYGFFIKGEVGKVAEDDAAESDVEVAESGDLEQGGDLGEDSQLEEDSGCHLEDCRRLEEGGGSLEEVDNEECSGDAEDGE